jgi:riboflavin kinase / FMN adenylyltransferase
LQIFNSIFEFNTSKKTVLTLGTFDGVHIGHQKIIKKLIKEATKLNCESTLLTFFPHPRMVLKQDVEIKLINTIREKIALFEKQGLQNLIIHPFDATFSELLPEEFVKKILIDQLHLSKIIIGYDHKFGKNRSADINDLIHFGERYNFEVEQISVKELNEISISSTKIRAALLDSDIQLANKFLGYNYTLNGEIIEGNKIGRTINFKTANLKIDETYKLIPKNGVYLVQSVIDNKLYYGMMNIGNNPTVNGKIQSIEIHYFNFNNDIYSKKITVNILEFIREEIKFESLDELKNQLVKDKEFCINYLDHNS